MQPSSAKSFSGISAIELLFVLAILAIVCTFATSSVSAAINAARSNNGLASLVAAITRARTIAASSETDVVLCPSSDGNSCATGFHWEDGWIAFQATHGGNDRERDEPIVLRQAALPTKVHLVTTKGRTRLRFQANGGNAGSNATFTFCDGRGARAASAYAMSNTGNLHATQPDPTNVAEACASH
jgi:type IV fimbrial biogenesis protein FimT